MQPMPTRLRVSLLAACVTALLTVAPVGGVMGAPPSAACAGDTGSRLNASPAAKLPSALTGRKPDAMIQVFTSLLRSDFFRRSR
jgi:hypothetical protein